MTAEGHVYPALFMLGCGGVMLRHTARCARELADAAADVAEGDRDSGGGVDDVNESATTSPDTSSVDSDSDDPRDRLKPAHHAAGATTAAAKRARRGVRRGDDVEALRLEATNGGSAFLKLLGACIVAATMTGIVVESVGGLLAKNNLLFQAAHEAIHLSFLLAGVGALLEAAGRAPTDSWRVLLSLAFLVEALVFYGHQLEQRPPEAAMHLVMAASSLVGAASALASVVAVPTSVVVHAFTIGVVVWQGLWLVWIAVVIYSPLFGVPAMMAMPPHVKAEGHAGMDMDSGEFMESDVYLHAGLLVVVVAAVVGSCFLRCGGAKPAAKAATTKVPAVVRVTQDVEVGPA